MPLPDRPSITVRVPAKVNLQLSVGPLGPDGFHPLATVFQAVSLFDEVTATRRPAGSGVAVGVSGAHGVPLGPENLAVRAAVALAERLGTAPDVRLDIRKRIPVAGGMAGGSADAAAALLACATLWRADAGSGLLRDVAAGLGSDVPFPLLGGTAVGTGRGDRLTPVPTAGVFHWVFATAHEGLATPAVFRRFDELAAQRAARVPDPAVDVAVLAALRAGDAAALGAALRNDLQEPALDLRPGLGRLLEAGLGAGALGGIVSGSGPTCAFLVADDAAAAALAAVLVASGECASALRARGPVAGASVLARRPGAEEAGVPPGGSGSASEGG